MDQCYKLQGNWFYKFSHGQLRIRICTKPNEERLDFEVMTCADHDSFLQMMRVDSLISETEFQKALLETERIIRKRFNLSDTQNPTYEEVLELKSAYELEMYRKPRLINTGNYYHKTSGVPLDVATVLYNCAIPYTPEKFKKYLEKRSIPIEHIKTLNEYLDKHFEIIDGKLNLTT